MASPSSFGTDLLKDLMARFPPKEEEDFKQYQKRLNHIDRRHVHFITRFIEHGQDRAQELGEEFDPKKHLKGYQKMAKREVARWKGKVCSLSGCEINALDQKMGRCMLCSARYCSLEHLDVDLKHGCHALAFAAEK